jgi:hypothetical protein
MSYTDLGYDDFLDRSISETSNELSDFDVNSLLGKVSGNEISSTGIIRSQEQRVSFDLDKELFSVNDGTIDRVLLGKFDDGEYGLRIFDRDNNRILDITGTSNVIKSSDEKMTIDLTNNNIIVRDETNTPRVLIGFRKGAF